MSSLFRLRHRKSTTNAASPIVKADRPISAVVSGGERNTLGESCGVSSRRLLWRCSRSWRCGSGPRNRPDSMPFWGDSIWSCLYRTWGTVAERLRSEPLRLAADTVLVAVETVRVTGG